MGIGGRGGGRRRRELGWLACLAGGFHFFYFFFSLSKIGSLVREKCFKSEKRWLQNGVVEVFPLCKQREKVRIPGRNKVLLCFEFWKVLCSKRTWSWLCAFGEEDGRLLFYFISAC
jgi:hypothetical protein